MQNHDDGDGTHWVCFKSGTPLIYFDAFGIAPPKEVMEIANNGLIYNNKQIQNEGSTACGWFCIACIMFDDGLVSNEKQYTRFLAVFQTNTKVNDWILQKVINRLTVNT